MHVFINMYLLYHLACYLHTEYIFTHFREEPYYVYQSIYECIYVCLLLEAIMGWQLGVTPIAACLGQLGIYSQVAGRKELLSNLMARDVSPNQNLARSWLGLHLPNQLFQLRFWSDYVPSHGLCCSLTA